MNPQIAPETLGSLVSKVMATSCGVNLTPSSDERVPSPWRTALLPIPGGRPLVVAIASDEFGCFALASGLLQMPASDLDSSMVEDSLREILNMVAGHIKRAMSLDQALGLPEIVPFADVERLLPSGHQQVSVSSGRVNLTVWVTNRK